MNKKTVNGYMDCLDAMYFHGGRLRDDHGNAYEWEDRKKWLRSFGLSNTQANNVLKARKKRITARNTTIFCLPESMREYDRDVVEGVALLRASYKFFFKGNMTADGQLSGSLCVEEDEIMLETWVPDKELYCGSVTGGMQYLTKTVGKEVLSAFIKTKKDVPTVPDKIIIQIKDALETNKILLRLVEAQGYKIWATKSGYCVA